MASAVGKGWMDQVVAPGGTAEVRPQALEALGKRSWWSPRALARAAEPCSGSGQRTLLWAPRWALPGDSIGVAGRERACRKRWRAARAPRPAERILKLVLGRELCTRDSRFRGLG